MTHVVLFWRGFLIVTLTAMNVASIAAGHYEKAILGGFGISFVWFFNSRTTAITVSPVLDAICYATGAACGTGVGMWIGRQ